MDGDVLLERECVFCRQYNEWMNIDDFSRKNEDIGELGRYEHDYTVAIVRRSWYAKRGRKSASISVFFRSKGKGHKLNYCPECGVKLRNRRK